MFGFGRKTTRSSDICAFAGLVVDMFCWIHLSSAAAFGLTADDQCLTLNVSGSSQSIVNGLYHLDKSFGLHCSSHSVWIKTVASTSQPDYFSSHVYIYYQDDGFDGWIISNTSCYSWGNFMAGIPSDSLTPYSYRDADDVSNSRVWWQEPINNSSRWSDSPRLTVKCELFSSSQSGEAANQSVGGYRRTALMISLYVFCFLVAVFAILVIGWTVLRRHRSRDKQASLDVSVITDHNFRYRRVETHAQDDALQYKHVTATGTGRRLSV